MREINERGGVSESVIEKEKMRGNYPAVGGKVGPLEGATVGDLVGFNEGGTVGALVGGRVGDRVGFLLGAIVGVLVGDGALS